MTSAHNLATFFFQTSIDPGTVRDIHWIMIAQVTVAGLMVLLLLGALIGGIIAVSKFNALVDEVKRTANPLIAKGTDLFDNVAPKVRSITENVEHISTTARIKVDELGVTVSKINETAVEVNRTVADINGKARVQAHRVHGIVSEALVTTEHVSRKVQHGVMAPVRQAAGLVAGFKAALETLAARSGIRSTPPPVPGDRRSPNPYEPNPYDL